MFLTDGWQDYTILDTGDGMKLEKWGDVILSRPDPQVIWAKQAPALWNTAILPYTIKSFMSRTRTATCAFSRG